MTIDGLFKIGRYLAEPTGSTGSLYYDTTDDEFKGYKESGWDSLGGGTAPVSSVFGRTGNVTAASGDYSVGNITGAAPLASPTFTGTPAAPTAAAGTNTTQLATTAFATTALNLKANLASPTFTGTVTATQFVGGGAGITGVPKGTLSCTTVNATAPAVVGYQGCYPYCASGYTVVSCDADFSGQQQFCSVNGASNMCLCYLYWGGTCHARCCKIQ